jgi:hypothetical protein
MTDEQRQVRSDSDELLDALNSMKAAEVEKRGEQMSTPPFHELADEVEARAKRVWELAAQENDDGDEVETTGISVNETEPRDGVQVDS